MGISHLKNVYSTFKLYVVTNFVPISSSSSNLRDLKDFSFSSYLICTINKKYIYKEIFYMITFTWVFRINMFRRTKFVFMLSLCKAVCFLVFDHLILSRLNVYLYLRILDKPFEKKIISPINEYNYSPRIGLGLGLVNQ